MITTWSAMRMSVTKAAIIDGTRRARMLRTLVLVVVLPALLAGCGTVRLAYNNGPLVAWWWIDGYFDFDRTQSPAVRGAIDRWFDWHRSTQLPAYAALLAAMQDEVGAPTSAEAVCRWQARWRQVLDPALQRGIELAVDVVPALDEPNLRHMAQQHAKKMDEMRRDFLQPDLDERRRESVKRALERAERLYGRLGEAQRRVIADGVAASPFDPARWAEERERRQRETLQVLRRLVAERADRDARVAALRALAERTERSPVSAYRDYQQRLGQYNCALTAQLHNATTPAQRERARATLRGWEDDLRALSGGETQGTGNGVPGG
jgi:hypothetical protein